MLAFGLSLLLLFYFQMVGLAGVRLLHASRHRSQDLMLSPAVGVAAVLVPTFLLNRLASLPVMYAGPVVAVVVLLAAVAMHIWCSRRAAAPRSPDALADAMTPPATWRCVAREYLPFFTVLMAGAVLLGRPLLMYNFDWLSFSNDDMANYALAGDRLLRHGYRDLPPVESLIDGTEYAQSFWYYHVPNMARCGAEMMLAWVCSLTRLSSHQAFMPLVVCFHIAACSAATAMIMTSRERFRPALCACILTVASAELAFGSVYQLIAQDIGLAMLCVNASLLLRDFRNLPRLALVRQGLLFGLTATAQMLIYPEVNPFLGGGLVLYLGYLALRQRQNFRPLLIVLAVAVGLGLLLLNTHVYDVLAFMVGQKAQGARTDDPKLTLFPFFLIPSGFANFWGLVQITSMPPEPGFSIAIVIGLVMMALTTVAAAWLWWREGETSAILTLISMALGLYLFRISSGFGLYKLAMFAQVFVMPTVALAWYVLLSRLDRRPFIRLLVFLAMATGILVLAASMNTLPERDAIVWLSIATMVVLVVLYFTRLVPSLVWVVLVVALPNLRVQGFYVRYSRDEGGGTFNEVIGATRNRVLREFVRELEQADAAQPGNAPILCDAYNISLTKMLAVYTVGRKTSFPSSRLTSHTMMPTVQPDTTRAEYYEEARKLFVPTTALSHEEYFDFDPRNPGRTLASFRLFEQGGRTADPTRPADASNTLLVASTGQTSLLNRRHFGSADGTFDIRPLKDVSNHLLFVDSDKSEPYYKAGDTSNIAIYQLERDPAFYVTSTMAGVGRYFLFEVVNPDEEVRVFIDLTLSFKGDRQNRVPSAYVVGTERKPFDVAGRGACRIVSPPIRPQRIRNRAYVGVDLGEFGTAFPVTRTGLMNWYGTNVGLDRRLLVGFGRDISVIGEEEYRRFGPPTSIQVWGSPESQLRHPDLEFSGLYEDGWLSEHSYLKLGQKPGQHRLTVKGFVADLGDRSFLTKPTLLIDGKPTPLTGRLRLFLDETNVVDKPFEGAVGVGQFELYADVPAGEAFARRRIEFHWSAYQQLLKEDTRKASVKVDYLAFE